MVLLMIANHARSDGTGSWPSILTLARESRLSRRTVQRCISKLSHMTTSKKDAHRELPELIARIGKGPYGANLYDIPGVRLARGERQFDAGGRQSVTGGASSSDAGGASRVTPNPSLTVLKDKETLRWEIINKAIRETEQNKSKNKPSAEELIEKYMAEVSL